MLNPLDKNTVPVEVGKKDVKPEEPGLLNTQIVEEAELHAIAHSLGVNKLTEMTRYQDQIKRVTEWAKSKGAVSMTDILGEINQLKNRLGDKSIYNMSVFAGLELDRMKLEAQMRKFEA